MKYLVSIMNIFKTQIDESLRSIHKKIYATWQFDKIIARLILPLRIFIYLFFLDRLSFQPLYGAAGLVRHLLARFV